MIDDLTEKNVVAYMIMSYDNPQCVDLEEFEDDVKIPKYIKRLINRYLTGGDVKARLLLNHFISFYNVFDPTAATRILFLKMDEIDYSVLKTFLVYLNVMPEVVGLIRGKYIVNTDIPISQDIANTLRNL